MIGLWHALKQAISDLKIRNKLFISYLILNIIPLAIIGTLTYQKSSSLLQERTNAYTIDLLSEVSKNIALNLREVDRIYYSIFSNEMIRKTLNDANRGRLTPVDYVSDGRKISLGILLSSILDRDDIRAIHLYSLNREFVFQAGGYPLSFQLDESDWARIEQNMGNLEWFSPGNQNRVVAAASSIYDTETMRKLGYLVLSFDEEGLHSIYSGIKLHDRGELFMIDNQGYIVSHRDKSMVNTRLEQPYLEKLAGSVGSGHFTHKINGINHVVSYQDIGNTNWKIVSVIPTAKYSDLSILLRNWMFVVFASVSVIAILLSFYVSSNISKPIRRLSAMMKSVERDRWDVQFDYRSRSEIGVLTLNFNRMIGRIRYLINQVYQEALLKQRSQLKYLMFQINPHFLFNTLETINWLARMQGAPEVGKLSKALGDLMREGIKGKEFVSLDNEISNVKKYVYIQQYRYSDKFEVRFHIQPEALSITVPRFVLQPLVENAMVHGMEMKMDKGTIEIRAELSGEQLRIEVRDNGLGMAADRLAHVRNALNEAADDRFSGIGLLNVHQRIRLHYGKEYGLEIDSTEGEGTVVRLKLPVHQMTNKSDFLNIKSESPHSDLRDLSIR
jgi:two-component system sensor histidine kinase YesM